MRSSCSSRCRAIRDPVQAKAFTAHRPNHSGTHAVTQCTRRSSLAQISGLVLPYVISLSASADETAIPALPSGYQRTAQQLVQGMKATIELELSGAEERKVRRVADESHVKELVKEFISRWQNDPRIRTDPARAEIKEAISELGEYYMKYGQRTKLTKEASDSILAHLDLAEGALPPLEESKMFGLF